MTSDRGLFVYATFVGRRGFEYGAFIFEPALEEQTFSFTADDLRPRRIGALPWAPALLDAVSCRSRTGSARSVCASAASVSSRRVEALRADA